MVILPIILFLVGIAFLCLGWRWQSPPSEDAVTALKGLAYLKREILEVKEQVQVHILEDKIQRTQETELNKVESTETEGKSKLYVINAKDQSESIGMVEEMRPQSIDNILPKYQEVLELATQGLRIPEIAQRMMISQDAVRMVLQTQPKGVIR